MSDRMHHSGYLIEFYQVGTSVKVSAIDPRTGLEVNTIASIHTPREVMINNAVRKLEYVLRKRQEG